MKVQPQRGPQKPGSAGGKPVSPARKAAFEILRRVESEGAFAATLLANLAEEMRADDRALAHELVLGVLRRQLWLDRVIEHFAGRAVENLDLAVKLALQLGLYQIRFLSRTPDSAAVNESVKLVHAARLRSAASFVNAVLRRATREPAYDPLAEVGNAVERLAVETSHPAWLLERWLRFFGPEAGDLARANNEHAPVAFRLTGREGATSVLSQIREATQLEPSKIVNDAWRVRGPNEVLQSLVRSGLIYLQDEASQLVAHVLGAQPADRILDVCAAPGSKALHLAALHPDARIVAGDLYEHRLQTLSRLAALQGVDTIRRVAHNAVEGLPFAPESFDRVLVDAPCSGTGTLRHNPEIRWRVTEDDIQELASQQKLILNNVASLLRRGGRLIYSTCSVEPEENEDVVRAFLDANPEFQLTGPEWPRPEAGLSNFVTDTGAVRTWPHRDDVDGFFIAVLTKR
ncbi:MAG: rRNA (cytosine967-C5)-methyltransferase [Blastocatellia bacterium]|jgi:16S rRNA (cytosine967-C5)-methyltransferase|nr:rRNA (cytosine967-C5)-methyltransferase [Blastocatellia bacterium]